MKKVKLAVLISALVGTSAAFAQQTPPAKPAAQGTQIAQGAPVPPGGASTGAAAATAGTSEVGATVAGLIGIGAVVAAIVVVHTTNSH
jgi:hypothetical protein